MAQTTSPRSSAVTQLVGTGGSHFPQVWQRDLKGICRQGSRSMAQHKNNLSPSLVAFTGPRSFWRRWWLILGEGRKLRVILTHGFARLIAGHCRRFITATRGSLHLASPHLASRRGCWLLCPPSLWGRGEEEPPAPFSVGVHGVLWWSRESL